MILSFHPNIVAQENILCAGRLPNEADAAAIARAEAVILPQGCSEALYRMSKKHCPHVFPNFDARFDFPGKIGQTLLFQKTQVPFPLTHPFETIASYEAEFGQETFTSPLGFPCVFKSDWGGEGEGVSLLESAEALEKALGKARRAEQSGQKGFLLQQFVPTKGKSLRVVVVGEALFSYWRVQPDPKEFLTSLQAGALIDHEADPELQQAGRVLAEAFCAKTGINLAGFDLIFSKEEEKPRPIFLEINYFFGRRGLGGSLRYYELVDDAVHQWLDRLGLSL
jgi:ribosomal protein S6--L-glutamate ligase